MQESDIKAIEADFARLIRSENFKIAISTEYGKTVAISIDTRENEEEDPGDYISGKGPEITSIEREI